MSLAEQEVRHAGEPSADQDDSSAASSQKKESKPNYSAKHRAGQRAIKRLQEPVKGTLRAGQILVIISGILAIAPYVALLELGHIFLAGHRSGTLDTDRAWRVAMLLALVFCVRLGIYFIALMITHFADLTLRDLMRRKIVDKLARVRLSWFTESNSGTLRKAIQDDTATVHTVIAHGPIDTLNAVVSPLMLFALTFYIDWRLALLSIATIPIFMGLYSVGMRGMAERTAELNVKLEKVSSTMVEFVAGIGVVKAFGQVGKAHSRYREAADDFNDFYRSWCLPLVGVSVLAQSWISVPVVLLVNLGGGAFLINGGYVDIVQVITCTLIALVLPGALNAVATIAWSYQLAGSAAVRLCDLLDIDELAYPTTSAIPESNLVDVNDVSYSYRNQSGEYDDDRLSTLAVDGVDLKLEPGTVTALVGSSGSGKTTLATLIARFDDPTAGEISLGDQPLPSLDADTLYSRVAFVLQDPQLLNTSIRNNIVLSCPDCTDDQVIAAAQTAQIHDFIMTLPDGYDTVLGTDTKLSGGQKQRIAIARALIKDAPILILDEATAFADPESEADLQKALSSLIKDRTVLVIAHRPAVVKGASQIVVLEEGRVCASGTHEDLVDNAHYRKLFSQPSSKGDM